MRLPYAPREPPTADPETTSIYDRISARRHPRPLIPLDLTLLHSPPVADGYNAFVGALRTKTIFPASLLELSICRVAVLTHAVYEWNAHAPLALKAGLPASTLSWARTASTDDVFQATQQEAPPSPSSTTTITPHESATLLYTDEVTLPPLHVRDSTFSLLKSLFTDREIVELTTTIAGYNAVSRILVSLDVGENNDREMRSVEDIVGDVGGSR